MEEAFVYNGYRNKKNCINLEQNLLYMQVLRKTNAIYNGQRIFRPIASAIFKINKDKPSYFIYIDCKNLHNKECLLCLDTFYKYVEQRGKKINVLRYESDYPINKKLFTMGYGDIKIPEAKDDFIDDNQNNKEEIIINIKKEDESRQNDIKIFI